MRCGMEACEGTLTGIRLNPNPKPQVLKQAVLQNKSRKLGLQTLSPKGLEVKKRDLKSKALDVFCWVDGCKNLPRDTL